MKRTLSFLLFILFGLTCFSQKDGQSLLDSLVSRLPQMKEDTSKVNLLNSISYNNYSINPDSGVVYGKKALELSKKIGWQKGIADAYKTIGVSYYAKSDYPKSLEYYFDALKIYEGISDKTDMAKIFSNMGMVYMNETDYPNSLQYHQKALIINEEQGNKKGTAFVLGNIGNVYMEMAADRTDSLERLKQKKEKITNEQKIRSLIDADCEKALEYHIKSLEYFDSAGNKKEVARTMGNMGVAYGVKKDYAKALEYYFKALEINRELGIKSGIGRMLGNIGGRYVEIAKDTINTATLNKLFAGNRHAAWQQAKNYIDSSIAIKKDLGEMDYLKNSYRNLSDVLDSLHDYKGAFENYKNYSDIKDSLFNSENEKKIARIQVQYEFDKKEAAARAEQQRKNLIRNVIYSGLSLALMFLVILLIQRNKIAKERRQISLEQERMRISRDLHDDLGSGLTGILMMSEQLQDSSPKELVSKNIEKIKKSSRQMVEQMGEIVWAMNSKNDTLENLVGYLSTYSRDYFDEANIRQQISIPGTIPHIQMTGIKRRNVFLVVKESLNNIMKHAQATQVSLMMSIEKNRMNIIVADNGKGFEMDQVRRFGNGLKNMQSRMNDLNGTYHIESEREKGTKTIISFPLS